MPTPAITALGLGKEFSIDRTGLAGSGQAVGLQDGGTAGTSFGDQLVGQLGKLGDTLGTADTQAQNLALGKTTDVAGVVTQVERANLALQLAVQVRNKAVDAYHEIFRMQI